MTLYEQYDQLLQGRNKSRRKLANNTYAERRGPGEIAIRLHRTDIITLVRDYPSYGECVILQTGGWPTVTTANRLNLILRAEGLRVYSHNRKWWITDQGGTTLRRQSTAIKINKQGDIAFGRQIMLCIRHRLIVDWVGPQEESPLRPTTHLDYTHGYQPARCHILVGSGRECGKFLSWRNECKVHGYVPQPGEDRE